MKRSSPIQKPVFSPFIAVVFAVISVTGTLMFFHVKNGPIMLMHEWLGLIFVVTGFLHLMLNLTPLLNYFKLRRGLVSLLAAVILSVILGLVGLNHKGGPAQGCRCKCSGSGARQCPQNQTPPAAQR